MKLLYRHVLVLLSIHIFTCCAQDLAKYGFDPIDSNKNGVIEIDEFKNWFLAQEFQVTINQIEVIPFFCL